MKAIEDITPPSLPALVDMRLGLDECDTIKKALGYYYVHAMGIPVSEVDRACELMDAFRFISDALREDEAKRTLGL